MAIFDHFEKYLGKFERDWADSSSEETAEISCFRDYEDDEVLHFVSIGLSENVFFLNKDKNVRQELLMSVAGVVDHEAIVSFLMSISEYVADIGRGLLRGEVIKLPCDIGEKIGFQGLYCAIPVLLEDEFSVYYETFPPTVIVWLVPVYENEVNFIFINGWKRFENLLENLNPNIYSLQRKSVL